MFKYLASFHIKLYCKLMLNCNGQPTLHACVAGCKHIGSKINITIYIHCSLIYHML